MEISNRSTQFKLKSYTSFGLTIFLILFAGKFVEPGIINTQMANDIGRTEDSIYPQSKRFAGLFTASLKTPTHPSLVAEKILEIAESNSWQLRYPVGPDALPFLQWRASMTDEEYVDWNAATDEEWYNAVQNTFGLDARQE